MKSEQKGVSLNFAVISLTLSFVLVFVVTQSVSLLFDTPTPCPSLLTSVSAPATVETLGNASGPYTTRFASQMLHFDDVSLLQPGDRIGSGMIGFLDEIPLFYIPESSFKVVLGEKEMQWMRTIELHPRRTVNPGNAQYELFDLVEYWPFQIGNDDTLLEMVKGFIEIRVEKTFDCVHVDSDLFVELSTEHLLSELWSSIANGSLPFMPHGEDLPVAYLFEWEKLSTKPSDTFQDMCENAIRLQSIFESFFSTFPKAFETLLLLRDMSELYETINM